MAFWLLGSIRLGSAALTGPTGSSVAHALTLAEHSVARGKPVLQDMGDELDRLSVDFFFDETFCAPADEVAALQRARLSRSPMPLIAAAGVPVGSRWIVEALEVTTLKTSALGRPVRLACRVDLVEAPIALGGLLATMARAAASAISTRAALDPEARRR